MSQDPVPKSKGMVPVEPSYNPDPVGEIMFVEHLTDEISLIVQRIVPLNKKQAKNIEEAVKRYLNGAL